MAALVERQLPASVACKVFEPIPQLLRNVRYSEGAPLEAAAVKTAIKAGEKRLGAAGRLLIRKSGTEPLIRVMAEGEDQSLIVEIVEEICAAIREAAGEGRAGTVQAAE
jgi:phosphoglucosamine mutase